MSPQQQQQQLEDHTAEIRTPDLCDRFRRFDFAAVSSKQEEKATKSASKKAPASEFARAKRQDGNSKEKKAEDAKDSSKPKRPMNGFMLFAKKYRLELIQQHPGKDNRAISVMLGEAWKALPREEREEYSRRAKVMADEQKKIHPDCWKRKRTTAAASSNKQQQQQMSLPPPLIPAGHLMMTSPHPPAST